MRYDEMKTKHEKELNDFEGMFFAFNDKQFNEGMEKIGLKEKDTALICSLGSGGYMLKSRKKVFNNMFLARTNEMETALKEKDFLQDALSYELANHEYCITYDFEDTFDALGLTFEDIKAVDGGLDALREAKESAMCCC